MTVSYGGRIERLMSRWKGSLWKSCWKELSIFLIIYYALNFTYRFALNAEQRDIFEKVVVQFNGYTKQIPITFLLGFYVSSVVSVRKHFRQKSCVPSPEHSLSQSNTLQRWWQQFENIGWPEDIMTMLTYAVPNKNAKTGEINPDALLKRRTIARFLTTFLSLHIVS